MSSAQVIKVKLPERTANRLEAEARQQRVMKPHDIRGSIPFVDYTNPAKFPPYEFREYPKMPVLDGGKPVTIDEVGSILLFYDAADEVDFKELNPELAEEIERNAPAKSLADTLASQYEEIEDLRARLRAAGVSDGEKKAKNPLSDAVRPNVAPREEPDGEPSEGIKLPPNSSNPLLKKRN